MPYAFTLPAAPAIRTESRLRPEQVDRSYLDADLVADIEARIAGKADIVTRKIKQCATPYAWPLLDEIIAAATVDNSPADAVATTSEQRSMATQATEKLVLASLYGSAGQLNGAYSTRASEYKDEANALIETICEGIQFIKDQIALQNAAPVVAETPEPAPRSRIVKMIPVI